MDQYLNPSGQRNLPSAAYSRALRSESVKIGKSAHPLQLIVVGKLCPVRIEYLYDDSRNVGGKKKPASSSKPA